MTEYVTLSDGKTHRITENDWSNYHHSHQVWTACGCLIRERQDNVDVYKTDEAPDVDDLCRNCDRSSK